MRRLRSGASPARTTQPATGTRHNWTGNEPGLLIESHIPMRIVVISDATLLL